jgi:hypothetical protein
MPYKRKGKCVFKKNTGKKVGCSKSAEKAKKYIKALYSNTDDEETFDSLVESLLVSMRDVVLK